MKLAEAKAILNDVTYESSVDGRTRHLPPHVIAAIAPVLVRVAADARKQVEPKSKRK